MNASDIKEQELIDAIANLILQSSQELNGVCMVPVRALARASRAIEEYEGTEYHNSRLRDALRKSWNAK